MFTLTYPCLPMSTLFIRVNPCLLTFTYVYPCLPMYTRLLEFTCLPVYSCLPKFTGVNLCLVIFNLATLRMANPWSVYISANPNFLF